MNNVQIKKTINTGAASTMGNKNYWEDTFTTVKQNVKERDYWLDKLAGPLPGSQIPRSHVKTEPGKYRPESLEFAFPGEIFSKLMGLSKGSDYSLNLVLIAALAVLLHKYTNHNDIIIGTSIYKQETGDRFLNTVLPLRSRIDPVITFKELLLQVRQTIFEANENQNYPVLRLNQESLFDTAILLENIHDRRFLKPVNPGVIFLFRKTVDSLACTLEYNACLYTKASMETVFQHYSRLLEQAIFRVNEPILRIQILSPEERKQLAPAAIENILRNHPLINDCAVLANKVDNITTSLKVFLDTSEDCFPGPVDEFLKQALGFLPIPVGYVFLSSLPRDAHGHVDRRYLTGSPFVDTIQTGILENKIKALAGISQAAVMVEEKIEKPAAVHLQDLNWEPSSVPVGSRPIPEEPGETTTLGKIHLNETGIPPAIVHGEELLPQEGEPLTWVEALERTVLQNGDQKIIHIKPGGSLYIQTYASLLEEARCILAGLKKAGLRPKDKVILQLDKKEDFLAAFWGCVLGGMVPVPLTPTRSYDRDSHESRMLLNIWKLLTGPLIVTDKAFETSILSICPGFQIRTIESLRVHVLAENYHRGEPGDTLVLIFTSGSTGIPKGVIQTHRAVLARERAAARMCGFTARDVSLNWLPLEHVVGLFMLHLQQVYLGCRQIHAASEYILADPLRWPDLVSTYGVTYIFAPSSAYSLLVEKLEQKQAIKTDWDLSSLRAADVGAEPINVKNMKKFLKLLQPFGLPPTAVLPSWGMSETGSGVVYSRHFSMDSEEGYAEIGKPLAGVSLRIADPGNRVIKEGELGRLQIKGATVTPGYYSNDELNRQMFTPDGWFDTGDLAFIHKGRLTITGRAKDLIIINGINYNNSEIEAAVEELADIESTYTAACTVKDCGKTSEKLAIFYCSHLSEFEPLVEQVKAIRRHIQVKVGIKPDYILPVQAADIPKTSIGKIQRSKLSRLFESGFFDERLKQVDIGLENENTLPRWFFTRTWKEKVSNQKPPTNLHRQSRTCLIFTTGAVKGLTRLLGNQLKEYGCQCIVVKASTGIRKIDNRTYEINVTHPGDYDWLLGNIRDHGLQINDIFHLPGMSESNDRAFSAEKVKEAQGPGIYSLLALIKALSKRDIQLMRLFVITTAALAIPGDKNFAFEKSSLTGFLKSLSLEQPGLKCCHLDLESRLLSTDTSNAAAIMAEWKNPVPDSEIAYRNTRRLVPRLSLLDPRQTVKGGKPLENQGLYLVTGGLGGIGIHVCQWLMNNYKARLIIVGRTRLPGRETWDSLAREKNRRAKRISGYLRLESTGGEFIYGHGDVADLSFLKEMAARGETRWNCSLSGVFHLAGIGSRDIGAEGEYENRHRVVDERIETIDAMFQSKIYGALALHHLVKDRPGVIFVAFSSLLGIFGARALSAYSAANSLLDGFCHFRKYNGYPLTCCLNWSSWKNTGMSESTNDLVRQTMLTRGFASISPTKGLHSLRAAFGLKEQQIIIGIDSTGKNIRPLLDQYPSPKRIAYIYYTLEDPEQQPQKTFHPDISGTLAALYPPGLITPVLHRVDTLPVREGAVDYQQLAGIREQLQASVKEPAPPETKPEKALVRIWQEILGKENIGIHDNFFELGGNSLNAAQLIARIHQEFNINLSLGKLFQIPFIKKLSGYIQKACEDRFTALEKVEQKEYYELSSNQKRLFILYDFDCINIGYNMPRALLLEGDVDPGLLQRNLRYLLHRHESLRTSFDLIDGKPVQKIHETVELEIEYHHASGKRQGAGCEGKYPDGIIRDFIRPFDLSQPPLLRIALVKLKPAEHILLLDMHHIISDGISMGIFLKEMVVLYEGGSLPGLAVQYKDFCQWQRKIKKSAGMEAQKAYWVKKFSREIPVLRLPVDYARPAIRDYEGKTVPFEVQEAHTRVLRQLARESDATLYFVLLALYVAWLSKLSGQEDIVVGTPSAGRTHANLNGVVGMFVNTLALRNFPSGKKTFREFLKEVKKHTLEDFENQGYQFENLVDDISLNREASRNPLFDVTFSLHNQEVQPVDFPVIKTAALTLKPYKNVNNASKFDMSTSAIEDVERIKFYLDYSTKLFTKASIERFIIYFKEIVDRVCKDPDKRLHHLEIIPAEEKRQILNEFNRTQSAYPREMTLHQLYRQQAGKTPHHTAVVHKTLQLTYEILEQQSNRLANYLQNNCNVQPGTNTIVGLMMDRSIEMVIGILGILKAGAAYLPIGPDYPPPRLKYMLEDSQAPILLTGILVFKNLSYPMLQKPQTPAPGTPHHARQILLYEQLTESLALESPRSPGHTHCPRDWAYIIFTSGSTGKPKGCPISHGNVVRLLKNDRLPFTFNEQDVWIMAHSYNFDFSVWEIFASLLSGGKLIIPPWEDVRDVNRFLALIQRHMVSVLNQTPGAFYRFIEEEKISNLHRLDGHLRYVIFGGDRLNPHLLDQWLHRYPLEDIALINMYGITETTVHVTFYPLKPGDIHTVSSASPIGRPLPETSIYILNENLSLSPVKVAGELFVGGGGLSMGYLNNPALTGQRFIANPFKKGEIIYKTGDMGRWLPGGEVEYLGRIDNQVKIRGYRVELAEIEKSLLTIDEIKEALVIPVENTRKEKFLCAYMVSTKTVPEDRLTDILAKQLPYYMIPACFVELEKIPLTGNGKIDRKALPEPRLKDSTEITPPRNKIEEKLTGIWAGVLGMEKSEIGIDANFFKLGGHSLKGVEMLSQVNKELGVRLPLSRLFKTQTIRKMAQTLAAEEQQTVETITPAEKKEFYPASSQQRRLFILNQLNKQDISYNSPRVMIVEGNLDREKLVLSIKNLIHRHELLRTGFAIENGEIVQKIHENVENGFEVEFYETDAPRDINALIQGGSGNHLRKIVPQPEPHSFMTTPVKKRERRKKEI